jgi:hypothetical protein
MRLFLGAFQTATDIGCNQSGCNRIDGNAFGADLPRQSLGKNLHARLGGRVVGATEDTAPRFPETEPRLMIRPYFWAIMPGNKAFMNRKVPFKLTAIT